MRALPDDGSFAERFDAVVNLFTSFGYFEDDGEQLKVLRQIRKALKPGGRFVLDVMNATYTAEPLVPYSKRVEQGAAISETRRIEGGFVMKRIVVREAGRPPRRYVERVKLYSAETLTAMLYEAGLALDTVYGSYEGEAYDARRSRRMIMVGRRKEHEL
ncbi:class I SAM-dependent methyltransferase [Paenibacillus sp. GYB003]|uniref:class I SAM-dependent methyltransferase n=1 Tax=Paenibacillus sp. GYB003 TaxID=2994392 RepID=UPI002F965E65